MRFPGGNVLVGVPKTPSPAFKKVLFYVDGATSQVRRVVIVDQQSSTNSFDFSNPRANDVFAESEFAFVPPPNTTIIR
jgi:outer membrane lipoprotein carrier protein